MMASQQSSITSTSIPKSPGPMPPPGSTTSTDRRTSNVNPTVSTAAPVLTDAVQKCVDTAAEAIATHREAKLVFMQGIVKRILREAYREPTTPPLVGTPLAQSVFAGVPPPSRGPPPYFVTHPNYCNRQFHHYYPTANPIPISQSPTTSATTTSTGMNTTQTSVTSPHPYLKQLQQHHLQQFLQFLEKHTELILFLLLLIWCNLSPKLTIF